MEVWMILLTTLFFFGASFGQSPDPNEFSVTTYDAINSELQKCAIPSAKMFDKSIAGQDRVLAYSTFDWFCYYEALQKNNQVALFMCKYYRFLVKTYYDDFCKSDSPAKKPLDKSVQYADFVSNPDAVCNYLQQNLQTADQQKVFKSPDECTLLCANAYAEFCENFGFILNIANNNTNPEETNNDAAGTPEGNNEDNTNPEETNNDAAGTPEEINEVPLNAEGYGNPPPADDLDDNTGEPGDGVDEAEENPGDVQIDDNDGEDVNGTNDGQDWDAPAQQGEGYDWDENEEGNNEDTFNLNQNQNDGNQDLFQDDSESTYDSADSADSEANQQPNEETKETSGHAGADEQIEADRNLLIEEERKFLEQESSSHFLAYSLTAIILVMVTYILYHNKQKIVAIIIEGRHGGQGKRRRYNQNVSEAMPTLKSAKLAV
ncbi:putative trans-Golgi network integral membrane protein 2-like isoform X3 [Apostichopus japonicus]|uniref:Putative trans-Golgi network integral membrane protein 2-like isoform X3 n=1 Tax=Stichopus japonicus TaxID=307972 RepID=A0A2G8LPH2_STIJA|nr:putative trans-Golgi network integral membrane protein 2-like isoform X3 [Apostichopus japonicus]